MFGTGPVHSVNVLTLTELELRTCSGLSGLLTFNLTRVACKETVFLEDRTVLGIDLDQSACYTQTSGFRLSVNTSPIKVDVDVEIFGQVKNRERLLNDELKDFEREIGFQRFAVDSNRTFTGFHVYAGYSSLSTSNGVYNFHTHYLISFNLMVFGFWPACGCSAPA